MIVAQLAKVTVAAIVPKVTVGHAKGRRAATGRTSHGKTKASDQAAIGHISLVRIKVTGHINRGKTKVTVKMHRVVIGHISLARIKVIGPIGHKASAKGHGHRAISSLGRHVAKASAHWHHRVPTVLVMTNTRCHKRHQQGVRRVIKTPCGVGAGG